MTGRSPSVRRCGPSCGSSTSNAPRRRLNRRLVCPNTDWSWPARRLAPPGAPQTAGCVGDAGQLAGGSGPAQGHGARRCRPSTGSQCGFWKLLIQTAFGTSAQPRPTGRRADSPILHGLVTGAGLRRGAIPDDLRARLAAATGQAASVITSTFKPLTPT